LLALDKIIQTLIVVPARSGSKGIGDKNIKLLGGKPLLAWTIEAIQAAKLENVLPIISTDSEKYAELSRSLGLAAPFLRPEALSIDSASSVDMLLHALDWFVDAYGYLPEQVMMLQPTSPFRSAKIIQQALTMMAATQVDSVIGCKEIYRDLTTLFEEKNGYLVALNPGDNSRARRQDVKPLLTPNGCMYLCKSSFIQERRRFYSENTLPLLTDEFANIDIDTDVDWKIAEACIQAGLLQDRH